MKRLAIIILLLSSMAMGADTAYVWDGNSGVDNDWSTPNNWTADDGSFPGDEGTDSATFNATVVNCEIDGNYALSAITMTSGYTGILDFNTFEIDVAGAVDLSTGGTIISTGGTGSIDCASHFTTTVALPDNFVVTLDGTSDILSDVSGNSADLVLNGTAFSFNADAYWGSYTQTLGSIAGTSRTIYIDGNLLYTAAASVTNLSITQTGTGIFNWGTPSWPILEYNTDATSVITMEGAIACRKGTIHAEASLSGAHTFGVFLPANDFLDMAGTIGATVNVLVYLSLDRNNSGKIVANELTMAGTDDTLTQNTAVITANTTIVRGGTNSNYGGLTIGVAGCDLGAITLGYATETNRHGKLDLGNGAYAITVASIIDGTDDVTPSNELDFGDAVITLSGTIDADDIACTAGTTPIISGSGGSAVITNVDLSGSECLDARGIFGDSIADGGGNDNVRFARGLIGGGVF